MGVPYNISRRGSELQIYILSKRSFTFPVHGACLVSELRVEIHARMAENLGLIFDQNLVACVAIETEAPSGGQGWKTKGKNGGDGGELHGYLY